MIFDLGSYKFSQNEQVLWAKLNSRAMLTIVRKWGAWAEPIVWLAPSLGLATVSRCARERKSAQWLPTCAVGGICFGAEIRGLHWFKGLCIIGYLQLRFGQESPVVSKPAVIVVDYHGWGLWKSTRGRNSQIEGYGGGWGASRKIMKHIYFLPQRS